MSDSSRESEAIANQLVDANLFDITGPIRINYSSSSIRGVPLVSYKDADLDLNFQDDEITRIQTALRAPPESSRPTRSTSSGVPPSTSSSSRAHPGRPGPRRGARGAPRLGPRMTHLGGAVAARTAG
jgi:hypothetical protein